MTSRCCWSRRLSEAPAARTSSSSSATNVFSLLFCQKTCRKSRAGKNSISIWFFLFQRVSSGVIFHASSFFIDNRLNTFLFFKNSTQNVSCAISRPLHPLRQDKIYFLNISSYSLIPLDITGCLLQKNNSKNNGALIILTSDRRYSQDLKNFYFQRHRYFYFQKHFVVRGKKMSNRQNSHRWRNVSPAIRCVARHHRHSRNFESRWEIIKNDINICCNLQLNERQLADGNSRLCRSITRPWGCVLVLSEKTRQRTDREVNPTKNKRKKGVHFYR